MWVVGKMYNAKFTHRVLLPGEVVLLVAVGRVQVHDQAAMLLLLLATRRREGPLRKIYMFDIYYYYRDSNYS